MVKLKLYCLNLLICLQGTSQNSYIDSMQRKFKMEDSCSKIIKDCWRRNHVSKYEDVFIRCIDTGLMYYKDAGYMRLRSMPPFKMANYELAYRYLFEAIEADKHEIPYAAYITFYYLRDYRRAMDWYHQYDALTPHSVDIIMNDNLLSLMGLCYSEMGFLDSALYFLDSLIEKRTDGKNPFMITNRDYVNRGIVHYKMGNYSKALSDFILSTREYSSCVEGYYYIAKCLFELRADKKEIISNLSKSLNLYDAGLKNNYPYGEYIDLPNELFRTDIMGLFDTLKAYP